MGEKSLVKKKEGYCTVLLENGTSRRKGEGERMGKRERGGKEKGGGGSREEEEGGGNGVAGGKKIRMERRGGL